MGLLELMQSFASGNGGRQLLHPRSEIIFGFVERFIALEHLQNATLHFYAFLCVKHIRQNLGINTRVLSL
jgi:hypothetical protein